MAGVINQFRRRRRECVAVLRAILAGAAIAAVLAGCSTPAPPDPDLLVTSKPMPLAGRPEKVVDTYLQQFPSYASRSQGGVRILSARDHGRSLSAEVSDGECQTLRISGRLGESLFPRSPGDLSELRDAYTGQASWQAARRSSPPRKARDSSSGSYEWASASPPLQATASWTYDSPGRETASYELTIRKP